MRFHKSFSFLLNNMELLHNFTELSTPMQFSLNYLNYLFRHHGGLVLSLRVCVLLPALVNSQGPFTNHLKKSVSKHAEK